MRPRDLPRRPRSRKVVAYVIDSERNTITPRVGKKT